MEKYGYVNSHTISYFKLIFTELMKLLHSCISMNPSQCSCPNCLVSLTFVSTVGQMPTEAGKSLHYHENLYISPGGIHK